MTEFVGKGHEQHSPDSCLNIFFSHIVGHIFKPGIQNLQITVVDIFDGNDFMVVFEFKSGWNAAADYYDSHTRQEYICTSIEIAAIEDEIISHDFELYPNPIQPGEMLNIKTPTPQNFRITNLYGIPVLTGKLEAGVNSIHIHDLPAGLYLVQTGEKSIKFIKN